MHCVQCAFYFILLLNSIEISLEGRTERRAAAPAARAPPAGAPRDPRNAQMKTQKTARGCL